MKYLITGNTGSGKSTIATALTSRGYTAYSPEELGNVHELIDLTTNKPVKKWPYPLVDWGRYNWNLRKDELIKLLGSADTVFIADLSSNLHEFYVLFDKIFVLTLDKDTLRQRLITRTDNPYGKHPDELEDILKVHESEEKRLLSAPGAIAIDATQTAEKVVDKILSYVSQ